MDLRQFRRKAARLKEPLTAFLKKLDDIVPEDLPTLVAETNQQVWVETDCLACANCCKTMTPTFTRSDVRRISAHLGVKPKEFVEKWLYKEDSSGDWVNRNVPCQFLQADNKCSIYEVRPRDCREFPHHGKKPFDLYNDTYTNNIVHCPATLELVRRLKKRVEDEYEW